MCRITQIRHDEHEIGQIPCCNIQVQLRERYNRPPAALCVQPDWIEIDKGVVLLNIDKRAAYETWFRQILLICLPGATAPLDLVRQTLGTNEAILTIRGDPECTAAHHRQIVGQA